MAINKDELTIGRQIYKLKVMNDSFRREKIRFVDAAGNEWYRYDKPIWSYVIESYKIVGKVYFVVVGVIDLDIDYNNCYHLENPDGKIVAYDEYDLIEDFDVPYGGNFYSSEEVATKIGEEFCKAKNAD